MPTTSINFTSAVQSVLPVVCGIPESALNGISPKYIVKITATSGHAILNKAMNAVGLNNGGQREFTVYGYLQEKIVLNSGSNWEGITQSIPGSKELFDTAEAVAQGFFSKTLISTLSTRRKWAGSNPITIRMKLKFEAFDNPYNEVILPVIGLQSLTLPRSGIGNTIGMTPPGPSPFNFSLKGNPDTERTENIQLDIGSHFLFFDSVIIKDANVTFENRMSASGPIGAEVDLNIETYQMLTREDLMKVASATGMIQGNIGQGVPTATTTNNIV